jgi:hypothetical protein
MRYTLHIVRTKQSWSHLNRIDVYFSKTMVVICQNASDIANWRKHQKNNEILEFHSILILFTLNKDLKVLAHYISAWDVVQGYLEVFHIKDSILYNIWLGP